MRIRSYTYWSDVCAHECSAIAIKNMQACTRFCAYMYTYMYIHALTDS